jgi:putative tricarboxylic transport membrane protein
MNERRPNWAALIVALFLLAIAGVVAWDASRIGGAASYARVGPKTLPYVISGALAVLSAWTAYTAFFKPFPRWEVPELSPVLWIAGGLLIQMLLLNTVGFSIATGLMFGMAARGFGRKPLWLGIAIGIPFSFLVWIVFSRILMLSLPAGPIERLIP